MIGESYRSRVNGFKYPIHKYHIETRRAWLDTAPYYLSLGIYGNGLRLPLCPPGRRSLNMDCQETTTSNNNEVWNLGYGGMESIVIPVENFLQLTVPVKEKILDPWISEQSMIMISGDRGTGKTWFVASILNQITRGEPFGPWNTVNPVPCLYIDGELVASDIQERFRILDSMATSKRIAPLLIYNDHYANLQGLPKAHLDLYGWQETLKDVMAQEGIKVAVFDNISSLTPGIEENSKKEWDPINQWLLSLRYAGVTSILLHHTGKGGTQRGTSGHEDNLDVSILLKKSESGQGVKFITKFTKARVASVDLPLIREFEFTFSQTDGCAMWTFGKSGKKKAVEILIMLDQGIPQKDIAVALNVDDSFVSKVKTNAIKDGHLKDGKLTASGKTHVGSA